MGRPRWSALAVVAVIAAAAAHPLCNLMFRCGCGWFSTAHCNIHAAMGPRCPWCAHPWTFVVSGALWLAGAAAGVLLARRVSSRWPAALAAALVGFAVALVGSAWLTKLVTGYERFLV